MGRVEIPVGVGCWLFTGPDNGAGYGVVRFNGKVTQAHRAAWSLVNGPIPDGAHIDHLCLTTRCVNPEHLDAVTPRENQLRSYNSHGCRNGHRYVDGSYTINFRGHRCCIACADMRAKARQC